MIALFINLNLNILIAGQTAPLLSLANHVEKIMSIMNSVHWNHEGENGRRIRDIPKKMQQSETH